MTAWDLFLFLALPLLVGFLALILTMIFTAHYATSRLPSIDEKLGRVEAHTSRLPEMERKLDALLLLVERGQGGQSVVVKLEKTGLDAIVSVRNRFDDSTEVLIRFNTPIIPNVVNRIISRWGQVGKGQIIGNSATAYDISLTVKGADPQATASALREFLALFDSELSKEKEWEARFEKSLLPLP